MLIPSPTVIQYRPKDIQSSRHSNMNRAAIAPRWKSTKIAIVKRLGFWRLARRRMGVVTDSLCNGCPSNWTGNPNLAGTALFVCKSCVILDRMKRQRFTSLFINSAIALAAMLSAPRAMPGQALSPAVKTNSAKPWTVPRTPDGQPDFQGIWSNATITPLERPAELAGKQFFTEPEGAAYEKQ